MTEDHEDTPTACHRCGTSRPRGGVETLTWVREQEPGRRPGWLCPACARRHAREIEARLDPEWW